MAVDADGVVVAGGLAGLVAAAEITDAGKRVIIVDREDEIIRRSVGRSANIKAGIKKLEAR